MIFNEWKWMKTDKTTKQLLNFKYIHSPLSNFFRCSRGKLNSRVKCGTSPNLTAPPKRKKQQLDFFLVSQSIATITQTVDIVPDYKTDHSMITLIISLHSSQRGNGFWKLNTSLLSDEDYVKLVKNTIHQTKTCYENDPQ